MLVVTSAGCSRSNACTASPRACMRPGRSASITRSDWRTKARNTSWPCAWSRSRAIPRLPWLKYANARLCSRWARSPRNGPSRRLAQPAVGSTSSTSAPSWANSLPQYCSLPWVRSRTRMPSSGPGAGLPGGGAGDCMSSKVIGVRRIVEAGLAHRNAPGHAARPHSEIPMPLGEMPAGITPPSQNVDIFMATRCAGGRRLYETLH